jgi:hypothetical protein
VAVDDFLDGRGKDRRKFPQDPLQNGKKILCLSCSVCVTRSTPNGAKTGGTPRDLVADRPHGALLRSADDRIDDGF